MHIGERIKVYRNKQGLSQRDLADKMGYSNHATIARIESGEVDIPYSRILQFSEVLNVPVGVIMGIDEDYQSFQYDAAERSNKDILASNLKFYMSEAKLNRKDVAEAIGVSYFTFCDWVNAKKYPRIDKVEQMANFFGITKSDLIEDKSNDRIDRNEDVNLELQNVIGLKIKARRKELNMTADELAERIGKDRATIYRYESGSITNMPVSLLQPIASVLQVPVDFFIDNNKVMPESSAATKNTYSRVAFAKQLRIQVASVGKTQKEVAEAIGVSTATFNDWIKGKKFPRVEKVELLAKYFGVTVAELMEENENKSKDIAKEKDEFLDIIVRLRTDREFHDMVNTICNLNKIQFESLKQFLSAFVE